MFSLSRLSSPVARATAQNDSRLHRSYDLSSCSRSPQKLKFPGTPFVGGFIGGLNRLDRLDIFFSLVTFFLVAKSQSERTLDTLGLGVGFFEFLGGAFEVGTHVLELGGYLLLQRQLLQVDSVVGVGRDGRVGVLLPCERLGPAAPAL